MQTNSCIPSAHACSLLSQVAILKDQNKMLKEKQTEADSDTDSASGLDFSQDDMARLSWDNLSFRKKLSQVCHLFCITLDVLSVPKLLWLCHML